MYEVRRFRTVFKNKIQIAASRQIAAFCPFIFQMAAFSRKPLRADMRPKKAFYRAPKPG
jgi:hypothetical protein